MTKTPAGRAPQQGNAICRPSGDQAGCAGPDRWPGPAATRGRASSRRQGKSGCSRGRRATVERAWKRSACRPATRPEASGGRRRPSGCRSDAALSGRVVREPRQVRAVARDGVELVGIAAAPAAVEVDSLEHDARAVAGTSRARRRRELPRMGDLADRRAVRLGSEDRAPGVLGVEPARKRELPVLAGRRRGRARREAEQPEHDRTRGRKDLILPPTSTRRGRCRRTCSSSAARAPVVAFTRYSSPASWSRPLENASRRPSGDQERPLIQSFGSRITAAARCRRCSSRRSTPCPRRRERMRALSVRRPGGNAVLRAGGQALRPLPSALMTKISGAPSRSLTNAIVFPSGDHAGLASFAGRRSASAPRCRRLS